MRSFADQYNDLLGELVTARYELNQRTMTPVRVLRGGTTLVVDLAQRILPTLDWRKTFPSTAAAEVAWFLSGSRDISWLSKYTQIWNSFTEDDGKTIAAAYGYRWRKHFGRDQLVSAISALTKDPSDRRVVISNWDPASDGLGAQGQKNVPCPVMFTLNAFDKELHSTLLIRSSDVFVGLPYDTMGHALLIDALAVDLGLRPGVITITLAHPHLYSKHEHLVREMWDKHDAVDVNMLLPGWGAASIIRDPDAYVEHVRQLQRGLNWPAFNPKPEVVL